MPWAIVGLRHTGHGGLFTQVKKDRLNHLDLVSRLCTVDLPPETSPECTHLRRARMTQSWYPHSGFLWPKLSACARKICVSSSASLYIRSSGIICRASSSRPGFSYFVGVSDRLIIRLRNFCDAASFGAGGVGILGRCRIEE